MAATGAVKAICLISVATYTVGFNIETTKGNTMGLIPAGTTRNRSIFYGYSFAFTSNTRMMISAPKWKSDHRINQDRSGFLSKCKIFNIGRNSTCSNADVASAIESDGFGMSMTSRGRNSLVCAPSAILNCKTSYMVPGFCYRSDDFRLNWKTPKAQERYCPVTKIDLMFVLDGSGSVRSHNFNDVIDWTVNLVEEFEIGPEETQVGVVQYAALSSAPADIPLGQFGNKNDLIDAIRNIVYLNGGSTYTAAALNRTVEAFKSNLRSTNRNTAKVLVLLTDGWSSDDSKLPVTAQYVRSLGITTFAVGVANYNREQLRVIATGNITSDVRVLTVENFSGLANIIDSLKKGINEVVLEGAGNGNKANFDMEMAQEGFSVRSVRVSIKSRIVNDCLLALSEFD